MTKTKVGITGQNGFIGINLVKHLTHDKCRYEVISFEDSFFEDETLLGKWVNNCDVIVHLAAMSRCEYADVVYNTNICLVNKLINALDKSISKPHILYTSSIQEELSTEYGNSKKEGRLLINKWAKNNNVPFTGLILPNVFGPFAKPKYASVIATFSYQLTHNETPEILVDSELKLIYITDLVRIISLCIINKIDNSYFTVSYTDKIKVSEILNKLKYFNECIASQNNVPLIESSFDYNLYNTFISYFD